ncbi:MAG: 4-(cytidine 5'-diphospho)-2-C-methyl-D-erythritol kinase [Parvularculaceae bacterium]
MKPEIAHETAHEIEQEIAPAKVNVYLHVGPLRRDRLHELKSLFIFADGGDVISARHADRLSLTLTGPYAGELAGEAAGNNLVLRAARSLQRAAGVKAGAALTLDKRLPVAAGIGGGSADAAATLRVLMKLWRVSLSAGPLRALAFSLGADVPACLSWAPVLVSGAGERIRPGPRLPPLWVCLVNPRVAMPTGPVFRAFDAAERSPAAPADPAFDALGAIAGVKALLGASRNDLQPFAIAREPVIAHALGALSQTAGALGARMSGSGATIFSLYASGAAATRAAQALRATGWWTMAAPVLGKRVLGGDESAMQ